MQQVPDWIVAKLGQIVMTVKAHDDGVRKWPARSACLLQSIQASDKGPYVTCVILGDLTEAEENFHLDEIQPTGQ